MGFGEELTLVLFCHFIYLNYIMMQGVLVDYFGGDRQLVTFILIQKLLILK